MSRDQGKSPEQERRAEPSAAASQSIAPGKVPLVKGRDGGARAGGAAAPAAGTPVQAKSSRDFTADHWMDAAHRGAVQAKGDTAEQSAASVHEAAAQGVAGSGTSLPHADRIQQAFGPQHDVSNIAAHVDGAATAANQQMGAQAYATGNHIAFGQSPDLHTVAHEAAHVVQQRSGVSLQNGVGTPGDSYERHADAVADRVVAGESASDLLDTAAPSGSSQGVQKKAVQFDVKSDLRSAMDGWGTDESAIYRRLERATLPELQGVVADRALMGELRSDLNQGEMERVLDLLRAPLASKLRLAMQGWGTDEEYIHRAIATASAADLASVANDVGLVKQLEGEALRRRAAQRVQPPQRAAGPEARVRHPRLGHGRELHLRVDPDRGDRRGDRRGRQRRAAGPGRWRPRRLGSSIAGAAWSPAGSTSRAATRTWRSRCAWAPRTRARRGWRGSAI